MVLFVILNDALIRSRTKARNTFFLNPFDFLNNLNNIIVPTVPDTYASSYSRTAPAAFFSSAAPAQPHPHPGHPPPRSSTPLAEDTPVRAPSEAAGGPCAVRGRGGARPGRSGVPRSSPGAKRRDVAQRGVRGVSVGWGVSERRLVVHQCRIR